MAWMYILECCDGSYYVGSTKNLELHFLQHQNGKGSKYTSGRLPVQLVYCEEYDRVSDAFYREKQVQGWTRRKREALMNGTPELLPALAKKVLIKIKLGKTRWLSKASARSVSPVSKPPITRELLLPVGFDTPPATQPTVSK